MSTKEYPLDYIHALHLLTGNEPVILESAGGEKWWKESGMLRIVQGSNVVHYTIEDYGRYCKTWRFRIYEPPAPEKLEPVELCSELFDIVDDFHAAPSFYRKIYGLLIAQAVRMAREEREAEKKGDGR